MFKKTIYRLLVLFSLVLQGCDPYGVNSVYQNLPTDLGWQKDHVCSFDFKITDSLQPYNILLKLRSSKNYPYSNIFMISTLTYPSGRQLIDTLEYEMATKKGALLGKGVLLKEHILGYKTNIKLPESGQYRLQLRHAVRQLADTSTVSYLKGITDVGFRVEKYNSH